MKTQTNIRLRPLPLLVALSLVALFLPAPESAGSANKASADGKVVVATDNIKMEFIWISPGKFTMGRDVTFAEVMKYFSVEGHGINEGPPHKVTITQGFYIAKHEVTVSQFVHFLNAIEPAEAEKYVATARANKRSNVIAKDGDFVARPGTENCAVGTVHWDGAVAFAHWWSKQTGRNVRLPTEAEWEFAARGPEGRRFPWGNEELPTSKWRPIYKDKDRYPHPWSCEPVGSFPDAATPDGVFGMAGAVGEWVQDCYHEYTAESKVDPQQWVKPPEAECERVLRRSMPDATERYGGRYVQPDAGIYGFRVVLDPE